MVILARIIIGLQSKKGGGVTPTTIVFFNSSNECASKRLCVLLELVSHNLRTPTRIRVGEKLLQDQ
jgi:hypothetical protein